MISKYFSKFPPFTYALDSMETSTLPLWIGQLPLKCNFTDDIQVEIKTQRTSLTFNETSDLSCLFRTTYDADDKPFAFHSAT